MDKGEIHYRSIVEFIAGGYSERNAINLPVMSSARHIFFGVPPPKSHGEMSETDYDYRQLGAVEIET